MAAASHLLLTEAAGRLASGLGSKRYGGDPEVKARGGLAKDLTLSASSSRSSGKLVEREIAVTRKAQLWNGRLSNFRSGMAVSSMRDGTNGAVTCSEARILFPNVKLGNGSAPFVTQIPAEDLESIAEPLQTDELWLEVRREARAASEEEPGLASFMYSTILAHRSLEKAIAFHLANKLGSTTLLSSHLFSLMAETIMDDEFLQQAVRADLRAFRQRDPACSTYVEALLNYKGYLACQAHRIGHRLWKLGRQSLALALQSRVSEVFQVDIHPAARVGIGLMLDHATGIVVGETAVIGDSVSMLHGVTLGGTGAATGDRHPKVGNGVLIGAGATLLGNIVIGDGAKVGAGAVLLQSVPPHATAVGNPAKILPPKKKDVGNPSEKMDHTYDGMVEYMI